MEPVTAILVGIVALGAFLLYERSGSGSSGVIVRPTVSVSAPSPSAPPSATSSVAPSGAIDATTVPIPTTSTASPATPIDSTPKPATVTDALTKPADTLSWIFSSGQDALKAGYGQIYKNDKGGLSITGPYGALLLKDPGTIYSSESAALKAGAGSIFQKGGSYFVTGPAGAVKVSDRFQPHVASADLSAYGSVKGVIRGWTAVQDRAGNLSFVPAHSVSGSTYNGDAQGAAPTVSEWNALAASL